MNRKPIENIDAAIPLLAGDLESLNVPGLNDHMEWDELSLDDLRYSLEHGDSIERAADFLCRSVGEVRKKALEEGLIPSDIRSPVRPRN